MDPKDLENALVDLLLHAQHREMIEVPLHKWFKDEWNIEITDVASYEERQMMTHDCGVVIRSYGQEFRLSIHEARW